MSGSNCRSLLSSPFLPSLSFTSKIPRQRPNFPFCSPRHSVLSACNIHSGDFTWDDVVGFSGKHPRESHDLRGFFEKVTLCNRNSEKQCEFIPFVIDGQIVGYVHNGFAHHLRRHKHVFIFPEDTSYGSNFGYHIALDPVFTAREDRTKAVEDVVKCLGEEHIPGIRNEVLVIQKILNFPHRP